MAEVPTIKEALTAMTSNHIDPFATLLVSMLSMTSTVPVLASKLFGRLAQAPTRIPSRDGPDYRRADWHKAD